MKKKLLALALALTLCFGTTMTANAAMNVSNKMGALDTHNTLDENSSKIPKGTLQYMASKFKIEYTQEDLKALKKIFDANLYAKAYPDVAAAYGNDREALWNHYVTHGIKEGRTQISTFNVFAYISAYPDLRNAFGDDLVAYYVHYANNGINENRKLTTVDAATKAGITVTGLQGQVIARPTPIQVPDLSSYSVPSSVPKADTVNATPKATTQPTETPQPTEVPSPSVTPTPTPTPEEPSGPTTCDHSWKEGVCERCGKQCEHNWNTSGTCEICNKSCGHEYEISQITDDAQYHQLICRVCGHTEKEEHKFSEVGSIKKCEECGYTPSEEIPSEENEPDIG